MIISAPLKKMMIPFTMISAMTSILADADGINNTNLFFGTQGGGNVFPGSTRPFGMVKMGVDVINSASGDAYSGYASDGDVVGISMMHESGTGGAPEYGVVAQLPYVGDIDYTLQAYNTRSVSDEASPGYYKTVFDSGITVELAAANRAGLYHYEFPHGSTPQIIVNGTAHLIAPSRSYWTQYFVNGTIRAKSDYSQYTGETTITGGWGLQTAWKIYYCGEFSETPVGVTSFQGNAVVDNYTTASSTTEDGSMGLVFTFAEGTTDLSSRVGISFISESQACSNIQNDFGHNGYDLDATLRDSVDLWNENVFNKVSVGSDNDTVTEFIYTALYGSHLLPSNRTGENPGWESSEPYYDDWFTIWDTFRCLNPLFNALSPSTGAELVRALIDIYRHDGFMPDGRSANQNGRTQGGSNADIVLADAYIKGITDGIDWEDGYAAVQKDAEVAPPYVYDSFAPDASDQEGRGALPDWLEYGWITRNYSRSVTRTVEYAYDDFAVHVIAKGLGKTDDAQKYLRRSAGWQNIWNFNASTTSYKYTGFVQPKDADGEFNYTDYDPLSCGGCYWGNDEYEGKPVEYGWAVPHDIETLKSFIGDNATFIQRLDDMFGLKGDSLADIGNEPSFLTPFLYNFVNEQYRTVELIRYLVSTNYNTGASGLPGNSDAGAMQAWLFWSLIGLYPVSGSTTYLISSPFAAYISLNLENGKRLEITANTPSATNFYVQSVTVNGKPWNKNWITHDDIFTNGGSIHFELGTEPVIWETGDVPPSPGHYSLI